MQTLRLIARSHLLRAPLRRRFATAQSEQAQGSQQEEKTRDQETQEEPQDDDNYETYNKRSLFSQIFRALMAGVVTVTGVQAYYAVADSYDPQVSRLRWGYVSFFYNFVLSIRRGFSNTYDLMVSPPVPKFLPDHPPILPALLPKTLVLNLEGTLVSKDFEAGSGVTLHLRPDFFKFMQEMSKMYEIVLYTNEDQVFLTEAIMTIDPMQRYFRWNFGRDYFALEGTRSIKDLRRLNRDPRRVVVIDMDTEHHSKETPENLILLKPYHGEVEDDSLVVLRRLLTQLGSPEVRDVRKEIKRYGGLNALDNYRTELQQKMERMNRSKGLLGGKRRSA